MSNSSFSEKDLMMDKAIAVTCFSMAVIIVGLNGLVIITLSRQKENNRLHFFIRHLAIADLLVGLIAVTGDAVNIGILHAEWLAGDVMCRLHRYACYVILIVSNNLLIGMSFDRFLAVKYPLRKITGGYMPYRTIIIGCWVIGLALPSWLIPFFGTEYNKKYSKMFCEVNLKTDGQWQAYVWSTLTGVFFLPLVAISFCYIGISIVIWQHWKDGQRLTEVKDKSQTQGMLQSARPKMSGLLPKAKVKSIKMTLIVCFVFFVCWLPATVIYLLDVHRINTLDATVKRMLQRLYPLNSLGNPLIFIMFNTKLFTWRKNNSHARDYDSMATEMTTT
ncbi:cardioacceleratory peptide receptor-like isoform X1 [Mya arenaria]|uniref:cardioacceleratory peptide receptor-like isoform X1 n=2 Tax=Mya arenaria TaxID=6604 RepID=UPI0022DFC005|nr:cardioacceleratory peptide receptor-like isoform X1 [Mya arenaria]